MMKTRFFPWPSPPDAFLPLGAALLAMISITIGASYAKSLFPLIGPAGTTVLRLGLAAAMLCTLLRIWKVRMDRRSIAAAIPYGIAMGGMNLLFYMAIQRIPLGVALGLEFTGPLAVALFASRKRADLGWITLAVAGLILLLPAHGSQDALDPMGVALALGAGVFWAGYILAGKRAGAALGGYAPALGLIAAATITLPFGIAEAGSALLRPEIIAMALVVAVLSSAVPYSLEMIALRRLPAKSFGIMTSAEPAVGAIMGMMLLGELLSPFQWLGIAAIFGASVGTTLSDGRKAAQG